MKNLLLITFFIFPAIAFCQWDTPLPIPDTFQLPVIIPDTIYESVDTMPQFPGGQDSISKFVIKNLKYPPVAKEFDEEGRVNIQFVVEKDGTVSNIKTIGKKFKYGLEEEAIRIIKLMPAWHPGVKNAEVARVRITLPIIFSLK